MMFSPSSRISPSTRAPGTRSFIRLKQRRIVLLPQPDGPMHAVTALGWIFRLTSWTARFVPYQTAPSRISSLGSVPAGAGGLVPSAAFAASALAAASEAAVSAGVEPSLLVVVGGETRVMVSS